MISGGAGGWGVPSLGSRRSIFGLRRLFLLILPLFGLLGLCRITSDNVKLPIKDPGFGCKVWVY